MSLITFNPNTLIKSAEVNSNFNQVSLATRLVGGSANQVLKIVSGLPTWATVTGGINYIASNPDAESDTAGWVTYADIAKNIPANGIGGLPVSTWTRSTVAPLRGTGSFLWTKAGTANRQGEGVAFDFTIDAADAAKPLAITFDYVLSSGTFTPSNGITPPLNDNTTSTNAGNSDLEVFVFDVTNSILIPVTPQVLTSNSLVPSEFKATFQTSSNSLSYRLIIHTATTTTNNYAMKFDNFYVGPQSVSYGPPVSDFDLTRVFVPNASGFGTISNKNIQSKRVGDTLYVSGTFTAGTTAASPARIALPLPIDPTKFSESTAIRKLGTAMRLGSSSANNAADGFVIHVFYDGSSTSEVYFSITNASLVYTKVDAGVVFGTGDTINFEFSYPVAGWSSAALMSNDTDTRVVAASYQSDDAATPSSSVLNYNTKLVDTHNSVTTGAGSWVYKAPVSGLYYLSAGFYAGTSAQQHNVHILKNGTTVAYSFGNDTSTYAQTITASTVVSLVSGDTIQVKTDWSDALINTQPGLNLFTAFKLTGPSVIAASEIVSLSYNASATAISGSLATIVFTNQAYDSHGAMVAGIVTAPRSGLYSVKAALALSGTFADNDLSVIEIQKNGTAVARVKKYAVGSETQQDMILDADMNCVAGDLIRIQVSSAATAPTIVSSTSENYISVKAA